MINYLKRVARAVFNRPDPIQVVEKHIYSTDKEYLIKVNEKRFMNQVAIITGASGCLGGAIAWRLALEGAKVYLIGRNYEKLNELADKMEQAGCSGVPLVLDATNELEIDKTISMIFDKEKHIDILVNCAGGGTREKCMPLVDQNIELIDQILNINLRGSLLFTRSVGKYMRETQYGRIVNISSVIGERGKAQYSEYAAAKAGIVGYTKSVAQELGRYNITVNCVSPGFIQRGTYSDDQMFYLLNSNYMNRVGSPEDVASAVAFVASGESGFITGQNLCVDGGRSLGLHGDK